MSLLEVKSLCASEPEGASLKDISFAAEEKGVYGFFCKDKETLTMLARTLVGACEPENGVVYYRDNDFFANGKQTAKLKKKIGYVPERCFFSKEDTVAESLDLLGRAKGVNPDKRARQIKEALELTGLSDKSEVLVGELTPSEKKRVSYAGSLLGNPDFIIIDEPFGAIDAAAKDGIKKLIEMLGKMKVVLLFSKSPNETDELCSYAAILDGGELLAFEPTCELLSRINRTVNALLRVREKGAAHAELMERISAAEGVVSARAAGASAGITDIRLECSTRDGMMSKISDIVEGMGGEVVSLRFASLGIGDVMSLLCERRKEGV